MERSGAGRERPAIGVDLGGTKIEVALVDRRGEIIALDRRWTRPERTAAVVLDDVAAGIREMMDAANGEPVLGVGIGVAGQVVPETGTVWRAPNLDWWDVPVRTHLEAALGVPVAVLNDVQAATLGEAAYGAGRGVDDLACVYVGTGVGGGVIAGGRLLRGCGGSAGEFGHITVDLHGPTCHCGNRGCLEAFAGGWAIARRAREAVKADPVRGAALAEIAGAADAVRATTVAEAARSGDPLAVELLDETVEALAAGVASIVNAFNPCLLLFGGGVIDGIPELVDRVREALPGRALDAALRGLRVATGELGSHAGTVGAAAWARRGLG